MAVRFGLTLLLSLTLAYTTYKLVTKPRPQQRDSNNIAATRRGGPPPVGPDAAPRPQIGVFSGATARPAGAGAAVSGSNQWGDPVSQTTSHQEEGSS